MQLINKSIVKWKIRTLKTHCLTDRTFIPLVQLHAWLYYIWGVSRLKFSLKMYKSIWVFLNGYIFSTYTPYLGVNIIYCSILLSINIEIVWCKLSIPCCNHELNRKSTNKHGLQMQRKTTWGRHTTRRCLSGCCNCG